VQGNIKIGTQHYSFNLLDFKEIHIPVKRENGVASFGIKNATYKTYRDGSFVGSKIEGSSCNLETITFTPHGNGTHTECVGHIALETFVVNDHIDDVFYPAYLINCHVISENDDHFLDFSVVNWNDILGCKALVIRSIPNDDAKIAKDYSGKNAPFILATDMQKIVDAGIEHLLVDLPSVDKEWDGGKLAAHHTFWKYPLQTRTQASITEFIYVPDILIEGHYLLKLNISPFISDAAPSKPTLYPLQKL
jgi:arylformamidase